MMSFFFKIRSFVHSRLYFVFFFLFGTTISAKFAGVKLHPTSRFGTIHIGTEPFLISVGANSTICAGVRFITHDGSLSIFRRSYPYSFKFQPISIGNDVFIGSNSVILPGVTIGDNVIVGAGAVVSRDLVSGFVYVGIPARKLCSIDEFCIKHKKYLLTERPPILFSTHPLSYYNKVLAYIDYHGNS